MICTLISYISLQGIGGEERTFAVFGKAFSRQCRGDALVEMPSIQGARSISAAGMGEDEHLDSTFQDTAAQSSSYTD